MSKKVKVRMQFSQTVYYDQEVEMTVEDFNTVNSHTTDDLNEDSDEEPFHVIFNHTNFRDICDGGDYENVELNLID